ncbi:MAG: hypothetical protein AAF581_20960, partial [Planctomycetota bacterium]
AWMGSTLGSVVGVVGWSQSGSVLRWVQQGVVREKLVRLCELPPWRGGHVVFPVHVLSPCVP